MDSDDWSSDSDSDSDSDGSDDESDMLKGRAKWLKKTDDTSDIKKRKDEKRAAKVEDGKKKKEKVYKPKRGGVPWIDWLVRDWVTGPGGGQFHNLFARCCKVFMSL